jgi:hypothetical protein
LTYTDEEILDELGPARNASGDVGNPDWIRYKPWYKILTLKSIEGDFIQ